MQVKRTVRYLLSSFWKKLSNVFAYIIFTVDIINVTTTNYSSKRTTHSCKRQRTLAIYRNRVALLSKPGRNSLFAAFQCDHCDHYEHWEDGHIEHIESPCRGGAVQRCSGAANAGDAPAAAGARDCTTSHVAEPVPCLPDNLKLD